VGLQSAFITLLGRNVLGGLVNKTDLIGRLAERLDGDRKTAQAAVEGVIDLIQRTVFGGDTVSISGFGVFEKRARAARTARNPRTGQAVKVKKTTIPAFRPGKYFKDVIAGTVKLPKGTGAPVTARAAAAAAKATSVKSTAPKAAPAAKAATKAAAAKPVAAKVSAPKAAPKTAAKVAPVAKVASVAKVAAPRAAAAKPAAAAKTTLKATAPKAAPAAKAVATKAPAKRVAAKK
jgi:DNA-binding protein HU-beta